MKILYIVTSWTYIFSWILIDNITPLTAVMFIVKNMIFLTVLQIFVGYLISSWAWLRILSMIQTLLKGLSYINKKFPLFINRFVSKCWVSVRDRWCTLLYHNSLLLCFISKGFRRFCVVYILVNFIIIHP